jgi:hypothetical protein
MRKIVDYVVGVLIVAAGLFFLLNGTLKFNVAALPPSSLDKVFGIFCILYGSWRIYRGIKRDKKTL